MYDYYAGIGSRKTPAKILNDMKDIGRVLAQDNFILRSGGAIGADTAFERGHIWGSGHPVKMEIYLPKDGFNGHKVDNDNYLLMDNPLAATIAKHFHPKWSACNASAREFHTRNVHQVLGRDLNTLSQFVICWTEDGGFSGGTGQAMRIADANGIPIFNMQHKDFWDKFRDFYNEIRPAY